MPRYTIEFEEEFDKKLNNIAEKKGLGGGEVIRKALASYVYVHRQLEEAQIECEPNLPWKLSITSNVNGIRRVVQDVFLP